MAQAEDTELRDLVIEALERNGSLAKIRALLRANIFLTFEDECENMKQNVNLDNILKLPEGILALSVVHEFLEYCCLKNTLCVYMSESRQGNEYNYDGKKKLADRLNIPKHEALKEPILLSLIKNFMNLHRKRIYDFNKSNSQQSSDKNYRENQNCTYILHDSQSSTTSNSNSDNSSDEKNKLHLRLQLDHSDTDTSSDSLRDKSSSEYIPGEHILKANSLDANIHIPEGTVEHDKSKNQNNLTTQDILERHVSLIKSDLKLTNSSSDSTSYVELKPFNSLDEKMLNTAGLPIVEEDVKSETHSTVHSLTKSINEALPSKSATPSNLSPVFSSKEQENMTGGIEIKSIKSNEESSEISYRDDFSSSPILKLKEISPKNISKPECDQNDTEKSPENFSPKSQLSQNSQSSVSLSDVADLLSEKSFLSNTHNKSKYSPTKDKVDVKSSKLCSDDSGDFTESPVPSLSNLSLDIHSD